MLFTNVKMASVLQLVLDYWLSLLICGTFTLVISLVFVVIYAYYYKLPQEFYYDECPSLVFFYLKALCVSFLRKQGDFDGNEVEKENDFRFVAKDCRINHRSLTQYAILSGYGDKPLAIPPCYLECYFLPLMIGIATSDRFRLSPLGLIHIKQQIVQHTELQHLLKEPFDLECNLSEYRVVDKGIEVEIIMKVYDRREMCVWEGVATLLSRSAATLKRGGRSNEYSKFSDGDDSDRKKDTFIVRHSADLGVQYARTSGDWNPHHLWRWSARMLGYKVPIAHGMWTMGRCITWLDLKGRYQLIPPFKIDVSFKRPIFLPSSSVFTFVSQLNPDDYKFFVRDEKTNAPQLNGFITTRV